MDSVLYHEFQGSTNFYNTPSYHHVNCRNDRDVIENIHSYLSSCPTTLWRSSTHASNLFAPCESFESETFYIPPLLTLCSRPTEYLPSRSRQPEAKNQRIHACDPSSFSSEMGLVQTQPISDAKSNDHNPGSSLGLMGASSMWKQPRRYVDLGIN